MLDVYRRVDVDAGIEQFLHVLVTLDMPTARDVGMRQLVDEDQVRSPFQRGVDIELVENAVDVDGWSTWDDLEPVEQDFGLLATMRLDDANDDVHALHSTWRGRTATFRRSCQRRAPRRQKS